MIIKKILLRMHKIKQLVILIIEEIRGIIAIVDQIVGVENIFLTLKLFIQFILVSKFLLSFLISSGYVDPDLHINLKTAYISFLMPFFESRFYKFANGGTHKIVYCSGESTLPKSLNKIIQFLTVGSFIAGSTAFIDQKIYAAQEVYDLSNKSHQGGLFRPISDYLCGREMRGTLAENMNPATYANNQAYIANMTIVKGQAYEDAKRMGLEGKAAEAFIDSKVNDLKEKYRFLDAYNKSRRE